MTKYLLDTNHASRLMANDAALLARIDAQIAAVARHYSLTVLTADKHFRTIGELETENWLAD